MSSARGYAAQTEKDPLALMTFSRSAPGPKEVAIEILYCGVCHSDLHQVRNDWGNSVYPCLPGHEIVGRVTHVGAQASRHAVGDVVGVGCMVNSCRVCAPCQAGEENYCEGANSWLATYNGPMQPSHDNMYGLDNTFGGYSDHIVVHEDFVLRIPAAIPPEKAAPILCAGVTTWSPMRQFGVKPGDRVGVIGVGGLGHMAVKLAQALGAEVVAFTTDPDKREALMAHGATEVALSTDDAAMQTYERAFDFMISTIPDTHDLNPFVKMLKRDATLVVVGALTALEPLQNMQIVTGRRRISGSLVGSIAETQEVLDFCAENGIAPEVEVLPVGEVNTAFERLAHGDVRFRFVLDLAPLREPEPA